MVLESVCNCLAVSPVGKCENSEVVNPLFGLKRINNLLVTL